MAPEEGQLGHTSKMLPGNRSGRWEGAIVQKRQVREECSKWSSPDIIQPCTKPVKAHDTISCLSVVSALGSSIEEILNKQLCPRL